MNYYKKVAYELCKEMGIEWDEAATVPMVSGADVYGDDFHILFPETSGAIGKEPLRAFEAPEETTVMLPCVKPDAIFLQNGVWKFANDKTISLCA